MDFNVIIPSNPRFAKCFLSFRFPHQSPIHISPLPYTSPTPRPHLIWSFEYLMLITDHGAAHCAVSRSLLQDPTFSPSGSSTSLSTPFSGNPRVCSSFNMWDQVSHPYKTTGKVTGLCAVVFILLDSKLKDRMLNELRTGNVHDHWVQQCDITYCHGYKWWDWAADACYRWQLFANAHGVKSHNTVILTPTVPKTSNRTIRIMDFRQKIPVIPGSAWVRAQSSALRQRRTAYFVIKSLFYPRTIHRFYVIQAKASCLSLCSCRRLQFVMWRQCFMWGTKWICKYRLHKFMLQCNASLIRRRCCLSPNTTRHLLTSKL
jgi:hypothetical protein